MYGLYTIPISTKKKSLDDDYFRKNTPKQTEYNKTSCPNPRCRRTITYKSYQEMQTIACPWCKLFFTPGFSQRRHNLIPWQDNDSPTDWDDI